MEVFHTPADFYIKDCGIGRQEVKHSWTVNTYRQTLFRITSIISYWPPPSQYLKFPGSPDPHIPNSTSLDRCSKKKIGRGLNSVHLLRTKSLWGIFRFSPSCKTKTSYFHSIMSAFSALINKHKECYTSKIFDFRLSHTYPQTLYSSEVTLTNMSWLFGIVENWNRYHIYTSIAASRPAVFIMQLLGQ